ncbi:MAG: S-methyl-5'-thioadenosine phosphorylase [Deltaproteobacteria bacterium]|nr:S-methyl-5'-thioadenosine phosphorylase [Deltaproteobacteria bacterium]
MTEGIVGIIGGSGLYHMDGVTMTEERQVDTPYGPPSDAIRLGHLDTTPVAFLARHGRRHTISPSDINFRANIWALKSLGVEVILAVSAVGSMRAEIVPGHLVIVDQFIDRTRHRPATFYHDGIAAHVSVADPICLELAALLYECRTAVEVPVHPRGTYLCIEGPMFSTRAESHLYRSWGVDVIGMTNYQEAILAREAEICYATIALATDYDCWKGEACDAATIITVLQHNVANAQRVLRAAIPHASVRTATAAARSALATAIITRPEDIPSATRRRLAPMLRKYVSIDT